MSTIYLNSFFPINQITANKLMAVCAQLIASEKPERLYFLFASPGGEVPAGIVIYHYLRALPVKVTMHNIGSIDSIANVIFHAADERKAVPQSTFLFHGVSLGLEKVSLNRNQLQELSSQLSADEMKIATILAARCNLTHGDIESMFVQGVTKDAVFAKDKGIIQEISQPVIPPDAKFISLNFT